MTLSNIVTNETLTHNAKVHMMSSLLLNYQNQNKYISFLILLSGDISLNPGPPVNLTTGNQDWHAFSKRGLHMTHVNINSLLPKIDELRAIAQLTNVAIIGITESKLDYSINDAVVNIEGYNTQK